MSVTGKTTDCCRQAAEGVQVYAASQKKHSTWSSTREGGNEKAVSKMVALFKKCYSRFSGFTLPVFQILSPLCRKISYMMVMLKMECCIFCAPEGACGRHVTSQFP